MSIEPLADGAALLQATREERTTNGALRDFAAGHLAGALIPDDRIMLSETIRSFESFELQKERQIGVASGIRQTDRSLELLGQKIDSLKTPLRAILKNFPPFPPEDQERKKLLMNYASIRKEIEHLTVPPPPDLVKVPAPVAPPAPLSSRASDSQINDHLAKLDASAASLTEARRSLAAGTADFLVHGPVSAVFPLAAAPQGPTGSGSMSEHDARRKSEEIGRQFAVSAQGVAERASQFLKVLS